MFPLRSKYIFFSPTRTIGEYTLLVLYVHPVGVVLLRKYVHGIELWIIGPGVIGVLHFQQSGVVLVHKLLQSAWALWALLWLGSGAGCQLPPVTCDSTGRLSGACNDLSDPISPSPHRRDLFRTRVFINAPMCSRLKAISKEEMGSYCVALSITDEMGVSPLLQKLWSVMSAGFVGITINC